MDAKFLRKLQKLGMHVMSSESMVYIYDNDKVHARLNLSTDKVYISVELFEALDKISTDELKMKMESLDKRLKM